MNLCIVGVGGVGAYYGVMLGRALKDDKNSKVSFIARGQHLEAIREKGLTLKTSDGKVINYKPDLSAASFADVTGADLYILTVKEYDLEETAKSLNKVIKNDSVILPLLNGVDIRERVIRHLDKGIVLPACVYISSFIEYPGTVSLTSKGGKLIMGPDPATPSFNPKPLLQLLDAAALAYAWEEDVYPAIWEKYFFIASFALVTTRFEKSMGQVMADESLKEQVKKVMEEIYAIAVKKGINISSDIISVSLNKGNLYPPETRTSLQRDVEQKKQKNELGLFGQTIIRMGRELSVATPVTEKLYNGILKQP